jgi:putative ABC transport system substrate-binding protein
MFVVAGNSPAGFAAKNPTKTIPIVIATMEDPVQQGFATSLAHPGGRITGLNLLTSACRAQAAFRIKIACDVVAACSFPGKRNKPSFRIFVAN